MKFIKRCFHTDSLRMVFDGPLKQCHLFFEANKYPCPASMNPADHYLEVISDKRVVYLTKHLIEEPQRRRMHSR